MSDTEEHKRLLAILRRKRKPGEWYEWAMRDPELNKKVLDMQVDKVVASESWVGVVLHPEEYWLNFPRDSERSIYKGVEFFPCEFAIIDGKEVKIEAEGGYCVTRESMDATMARKKDKSL